MADYVVRAKSPNTLRAYAADWRHFAAWCARSSLPAVPASSETVALYATALAESASASTVMRRISALSQVHQLAGFASPNTDPGLRTVLAGIRRSKGMATRGKNPLLVEDLKAMVAGLPDNFRGRRDRALLLLGFSGAFGAQNWSRSIGKTWPSAPRGSRFYCGIQKPTRKGPGERSESLTDEGWDAAPFGHSPPGGRPSAERRDPC